MDNLKGYHFQVDDVPGAGPRITGFFAPGDCIPDDAVITPPTAAIAVMLAQVLRRNFCMDNTAFNSFARTATDADSLLYKGQAEPKTYDVYLECSSSNRGGLHRDLIKESALLVKARQICTKQPDFLCQYVLVDKNGRELIFSEPGGQGWLQDLKPLVPRG